MRERKQVNVIRAEPEFRAEKDHIVAVFPVGPDATFGVRFESPEHLLQLMSMLMEEAAKVWPNNEWVKEYMS